MGQYPLYEALMAKKGWTGYSDKLNYGTTNSTPTNEVSSSSVGINTLEDLMNQQSGGYNRNDPTLWSINGQKVRIDPKLYQDYVNYNRAWYYSDIFQREGIKNSEQYKNEWTKQYLQNYNAGTLPTINQPGVNQPTTALPTMNQPTISQPITNIPTMNQPLIKTTNYQLKEDNYRLPEWTGNIEYNSWLKDFKRKNKFLSL